MTSEEVEQAWKTYFQNKARYEYTKAHKQTEESAAYVQSVAEYNRHYGMNDFKSSLRKCIEGRIAELENDESEFSDEEVFFALRENRTFLELLDTVMPLKQ